MNGRFEQCFVIGTGQFAFNCAKYMSDKYALAGIYEYGNLQQSSCRDLCDKYGLPYVPILDKEKFDGFMRRINESGKRTLFISASNTYIFPDFITDNKNIKVINYHPALLSKHLGRNAEAWAIYEQDRIAGITWHEVTSEIDKGAILAEREIELADDITSIRLMIKQYQLGFAAFKQMIGGVMRGEEGCTKKCLNYGKMHYSFQKPNDGILDPSWDAGKISAFLRCMDYGSLKILGEPVMLDKSGGQYGWDFYKIFYDKADDKSLPNDKVIEKDGVFFILRNYRQINSALGSKA